MTGNILLLAPIIIPLIAGAVLKLFKLNENSRKIYVMGTMFVNLAVLLFTLSQSNNSLTVFKVSEALSLQLHVDELSKFFTVLVSVIFPMVAFYAFEYMSHEGMEDKFFTFYTMTLGTLMGVGFSGNLITFYLFYEMMTFITYPLVTHSMSKEALDAGKKYIIYSLIGAQLSLIAMMFVYYFGDSLTFTAGGVMNPSIVANNPNLVLLVYMLTIFGFGAKAGMYPLHAWLPQAHPVAPAPGSAVLSGIITKAGIMGVIRMTYYIFGYQTIQNTWAHYFILSVILLTIFLGSMLAFNAKQMKVRLAYSSVSQVSYVLLGILIMNQQALIGGFMHMLAHAIVKNTLFLAVGAIMYKTGYTSVDQLKGIGKKMPITMWCFTAASLALVGIPPFIGFVSKWYLGTGALGLSVGWFGMLAVATLIVSAILTAGYLLSMAANAFFPGKDFDYSSVVNMDPSYYMTIPLVTLAGMALVFGIYPNFFVELFTKIAAGLF